MKTIKINTTNGTREVDAFVYGCWAAHEAYAMPGWTVTHVPSGHGTWVLAMNLSERESRRIARLLSRRVPSPRMIRHKSDNPLVAPVIPTEEDRCLIEATFAEELAA